MNVTAIAGQADQLRDKMIGKLIGKVSHRLSTAYSWLCRVFPGLWPKEAQWKDRSMSRHPASAWLWYTSSWFYLITETPDERVTEDNAAR